MIGIELGIYPLCIYCIVHILYSATAIHMARDARPRLEAV
jgi:hypothetical protein